MKLYTSFRSSASFRVRIALNLKGIAWESATLSLARGEHHKGEYAAVNPQALVPALVDGGPVLSQSLAIIEYLEETVPNPPLLPREPRARARVRSLALLVACEIHPLNNLRVLGHLRKNLGQSEDGVNAWYRHWVAEGLSRLEAQLAEGERSPFCVGTAPTMADCCLVPQIFNAQRFACDTAPYPLVMGIFERCMALEAFQRAQPSRQPDAE